MHTEILSETQTELLHLLKEFRKEFYLVGGTAIALQIGHRRSIDFDLFKYSQLRPKTILQKLNTFDSSYKITRNVTEQLNLTLRDVKFTFYQYPFDIPLKVDFKPVMKMPDLLTLSAMKAYALGRRSKWKDYVDLFFVLKSYYSIEEISKQAESIFGQLFSEKLFRIQLSYFDDIDFSEVVEYTKESFQEEEIKSLLVEKSIQF